MKPHRPVAAQRLSSLRVGRFPVEQTDMARDAWQPRRSAAHRHYSPSYEGAGVKAAATVVAAEQQVEA